MRSTSLRHLSKSWRCVLAGGLIWPGLSARAAEPKPNTPDLSAARAVLAESEWQAVEKSVDRGLAWLSRQQKKDGSFQQQMRDEPGISGLCLLAFLSRGHIPDEGPYGEKLSQTRDFILASQQGDGLISRQRHLYHAAYNHGIGALAISELYGMAKPVDDARQRAVIENALRFSGFRYSQPKAFGDDEGGWRYFKRHGQSDSDLSVTSWNMMFLRSAKNAGFKVDVRLIDEALGYLERVYDPSRKTFRYEIHTDDPPHNYTRGMAGAGVLSMALAGKHDSDVAQNAARYILQQPFDQYTHPTHGEQYPCYSAFYCSQGMFQMGGYYWSKFYPTLVRTLINAQRADGSWIMQQGHDTQYGAQYMTALTILALTPPYQTLPIFQR